jgi:hypothetical protein
MGNIFLPEENIPGAGVEQTHDHLEKRRFPGSVGADDGTKLPLIEGQSDILDRTHAPKILGQIFNF